MGSVSSSATDSALATHVKICEALQVLTLTIVRAQKCQVWYVRFFRRPRWWTKARELRRKRENWVDDGDPPDWCIVFLSRIRTQQYFACPLCLCLWISLSSNEL